MRYKLVAMDLDGTLLPDDKVLPEGTIAKIMEARANGVRFTIATGRMFRGAVRYAHQLGIDTPVITYNGAMIKNPVSGESYREYRVPAGQALQAIDALRNEPVLRYVFAGDDVYTDTPHAWTDNYANILEVEMRFVDDVRSMLNGTSAEDPIMVVFMVPSDMRIVLSDVLRGTFDSQVRITNSSEWFVDVLHPQASKSLALRQLAAKLGIAKEEIIAVGDNLNDLEMIEYAGLGVAVSNAIDGLKEVADYITEAPFNLGVEEIIDKFL